MNRIDFVPEDYVQLKESHRANFFFLAIVALITAGLLGTFGIIKVRQEAVATEARTVDERMEAVQQSIKQLESLQANRREMMKTALLAAELIEPVPRSVITAFLTNALPDRVTLTGIEIKQSKSQQIPSPPAASNQYEAAKAAAEQKPQRQIEITAIEIEGLAASDIEVADYIASLSAPLLLENVSLVHSMQKEIKDTSYRQFKLTAQLRDNLTMTNELVEKIRNYKPIKSGI
ncbi:MAG: PilN domain-containing protein [Sedimentisphaerales bacterium]